MGILNTCCYFLFTDYTDSSLFNIYSLYIYVNINQINLTINGIS